MNREDSAKRCTKVRDEYEEALWTVIRAAERVGHLGAGGYDRETTQRAVTEAREALQVALLHVITEERCDAIERAMDALRGAK